MRRNPYTRARISTTSILLVLFLMTSLATLGSAQTVPNVAVDIDQDKMLADISLGLGVTIRYTGNVTLEGGKANGVTLEAEILKEDWEVRINPDTYQPVTGDSTIEFNGQVRVPSNAVDGNYDLKVSATIDTPGVYPPAVFHDIMVIEVVKNRVKVIVEGPDFIELQSSNVTQTHVFSFKVLNRGSTDDVFGLGIIDRFNLRDKGWVLNLLETDDNDEIDIHAGSFVYINLEVVIPAFTEGGEFTVNLRADSSETDSFDEATARVKVTPVIKEPAGKEGKPWTFLGIGYLGWFTISLVVLGVCMMVFLGGTEIGFFMFLIYILVPLYVRLKKEKILDNFTRGQIFGYIKANPGTHYMEIQNHLDVSNGVLAHHLTVLEREEFIKSNRDGLYKRFYPRHVKVSKKGKHLTRLQKDILEEVERHPGIVQKTLARFLGESKQVISYHIKVLAKAKLIRIEKEGSYHKIYSKKSHKARTRPKKVIEVEEEAIAIEAEPVGSSGSEPPMMKL
jgi:predicted transcriptional regulator